MTLVMVMTLVMSVEPMRVRAAMTYTSGRGVAIHSESNMWASPSIIDTGDIFYSGSYIKGRKDSTRSTQVNSFDESVIGNKKIESIEDMHLNFVKYLQSTKKELIDQEKFLEE